MPEKKYLAAEQGEDITFVVDGVTAHVAYKGSENEHDTVAISFTSKYGNKRLYTPSSISGQMIFYQLCEVLGQDEADWTGATITLKSVPYDMRDQVTKKPTGEIGYNFSLVNVVPAIEE